MKLALFLVVSGLFLTLLSSQVAAETFDKKFIFPKYPQTCASEQIDSMFWDTQKCEHCKLNCQCTEHNGCTKCIGGTTKYQLLTETTSGTGTAAVVEKSCKPCPNIAGVDDCCFFKSAEVNVNQSNAFHATTCKADHLIFGHFCYKINNCKSYTKYARCFECNSGYYLTPNYTCDQCLSRQWGNDDDQKEYDWNTDYKYKDSVANDDTNVSPHDAISSSTRCKTCNGKFQCSECIDGFYLATNAKRDTYDINMAKSPSFCRPCNKNCKCSADPETKIINMCTECLISEGYYRDENDWTCKKCSSVDGLSNCKTCSWDKVLKVPICQSCNAQSDVADIVQIDIFTDKELVGDTTRAKNSKIGVACVQCRFPNPNDATKSNFFQGDATLKDVWGEKTITLDIGKSTDFFQKQVNLKISSIKESNLSDLSAFYNGFQNNIASVGDPNCNKCAVQKITKQKIDATAYVDLEASAYYYYTVCSECDNGYAMQELKAVVKYNSIDNTDTTISTLNQCQKCTYLLDKVIQDKYAALTADDQKQVLADDQASWQYVRRCERANVKDYTITQCGTTQYSKDASAVYAYPASFWELKNSLTGGDEENVWRGPKDTYTVDGGINTFHALKFGQTYLVKVDALSMSLCVKQTLSGDKQTRCQKMANYPKDIKDRDLCDTCYPNIGVNPDSTYVLTNLKKCKPCPTPCSSCEKENKDLSNLVVCKSCPVIGQNESAPALWDNLQKDGTGKALKNYFFVADQTDGNAACKTCNVDYCFECNADLSCKSCFNGFRELAVGTAGGSVTCEKCKTPNCRKCQAGTTNEFGVCDECFQPYNKVTIDLPDGTKQTVCQTCEINCIKCSEGKRKQCEVCKSGFYLDKGVCKNIRDGCVNSTPTGECKNCGYGYRLVDGWCWKCFNPQGGYFDCPTTCTMTTFTSAGTNTRKVDSVKPADDPVKPKTRILELLDEDFDFSSYNDANIIQCSFALLMVILSLII